MGSPEMMTRHVCTSLYTVEGSGRSTGETVGSHRHKGHSDRGTSAHRTRSQVPRSRWAYMELDPRKW
ncbi:hypothetical protein TNCV_3513391, partial [Trichonephila clavipes]